MITAETYSKRRQAFIKTLNGEVAVITAFTTMQQTNDAAAPFVQESSFYWLTGITDPDWLLVITDNQQILVSPVKSDIHRIFDGGLSAEEAIGLSGVETVLYKAEYEKLLKEMATKHEKVFTVFKHPYADEYGFALNPAPQRLIEVLDKQFKEVVDCRKELSKLKAIKSPEEIAIMQRAIDISIDGFNAMKAAIKTSKYEYQLEAVLSHSFRAAGSEGHAYQPIVGMGKNACTLHYIANNSLLPANGMVLVDAGAKVDGYAADITRTYKIGEPSEGEIAVHGEVEKAQKEIIALIQPGVSVQKYHEDVDVIMKQALKNLGLLKKSEDYRKYFPHAVSHGLGIDVHDSLGGFETFQPGMVLTVEPGIYITEEGIGVRIEDDILVTDEGNINMTAALPTAL